jgi:hypothetical protein
MEEVESRLVEIINKDGESIAYAQNRWKPEAMRMLIEKGYSILFSHEIIDCKLRFYHELLRITKIKDAKIKRSEASKLMNIRELYEKDFTSLSVHVLLSEEGKGMHYYIHCPHYFCNPDMLEKTITTNDILYYPKEELRKIILNNENVWKVPDTSFRGYKPGAIEYTKNDDPVKKVMHHPQTIPCCNGEDRARKYVRFNIEGLNQVSHWYKRGNPQTPNAWFIQLGCAYITTFEADDGPHAAARFLGVKKIE